MRGTDEIKTLVKVRNGFGVVAIVHLVFSNFLRVFCVITLENNTSAFKLHDMVGVVQKVKMMRNKDASFVFQLSVDALFEDVVADSCVEGGKGIIHDDDFGVAVHHA